MRSVVITGCGLVTPHGDLDQTWAGLCRGEAPVARQFEQRGFPFCRGYDIDPNGSVVPNRAEYRAMGPSMRFSVAATGMALSMAGLLGRDAELEAAALLIAARFAERDAETDRIVGDALADCDDYAGRLNALLYKHLRPGLFLAQLPNLFAGNISLTYQIRGTSITFLGEHGAGASAVSEGYHLVRDGATEIAIVGGCFSGGDYYARFFAAGLGCLAPDDGPHDTRPVSAWGAASDGTVCGTAAAFCVLESAEHAAQRKAAALAELEYMSCEVRPRQIVPIADSLCSQLEGWRGAEVAPGGFIGNGSGIPEIDAAELRFFDAATRTARAPVWITSPTPGLGELFHASLATRLALAALALKRRSLFGTPQTRFRELPEGVRVLTEARPLELDSLGVVSIGTHESESLAILRRARGAA